MTPLDRRAGAAAAVRRGWRAVRWYVKACTGESRWDDYLRDCARHGRQPVSRREFERRRADALERRPSARCC